MQLFILGGLGGTVQGIVPKPFCLRKTQVGRYESYELQEEPYPLFLQRIYATCMLTLLFQVFFNPFVLVVYFDLALQ